MSKIFEDYGKEMREEGAKGKLLENIEALMETMHLTAERAMDALRVPIEDRDGVRNRITAY